VEFVYGLLQDLQNLVIIERGLYLGRDFLYLYSYNPQWCAEIIADMNIDTFHTSHEAVSF
jgi:hypothetical protein